MGDNLEQLIGALNGAVGDYLKRTGNGLATPMQIIRDGRAVDLSRYSHDNPGWIAAWDAGLNAHKPARAIDMLIAMQQIADKDSWLDAEPTVDESLAFASANIEHGAEW